VGGRRPLHLILLLALALRLYHLFEPPWDYHNWRQTITLMVARDFARRGFPLLDPQVAWVSHNRPADPSYFSGEFSLESILAAGLYRIFGESDALARLVVIVFSLAGIYFLYDLLNRRAGPRAAAAGAFLYALLPYHLFFGRVFMPDVPALSLALGGLDLLDRWTERPRLLPLMAGAAITCLAVLQKLPVAFVGLPMIYLVGRRFLRRAEPYIWAVVAAVPAVAWYVHSAHMAQQSGFAIMQPGLFGSHLALWLHPPFARQMLWALVEAFSPIGLGVALAGLFAARGPLAWVFRLWVIGAGAFLALTPEVLPSNHYYLLLLLPGGAALGGLALARLPAGAMVLALAIFAAAAIHSALPLYQADRLPYDLGAALQRVAAPRELIVTESGGSPNVLYFADRRGWMLNRNYDPALIERLQLAGARYYADVFAGDAVEQREFFRVMDGLYRRITPGVSGFVIFDLSIRDGGAP
jgi:hypothetical protein